MKEITFSKTPNGKRWVATRNQKTSEGKEISAEGKSRADAEKELKETERFCRIAGVL